MTLRLLATIISIFAAVAPSVQAQMLDPAMDQPDEPFSYFSKPTDVIGVMDGTAATLVSPEGYLYTGFAELMFFTGNPPAPVNQRVKTLRKGYLPIVEYRFERQQFLYTMTMFAVTLDGNPASSLMNFVRVTVENVGAKPRTNFFSVATRYQNEDNTGRGHGDNRFRRPATPKRSGEYLQAGVAFNPDWVYGFRDDAFVRDGKVLFLFAHDPKLQRLLTLKTGGYVPRAVRSNKPDSSHCCSPES